MTTATYHDVTGASQILTHYFAGCKHDNPEMELSVAMRHALVDDVGSEPGQPQVLYDQIGLHLTDLRRA